MSQHGDRWMRLWSRLSRRRSRQEVEDEFEAHLQMLVEQHQDSGLDPRAARRKAEAQFGDVARYRHQALRVRGARIRKENREQLMDSLRQDLRFAFRQLRKRPGFSALALAMLALGIGANTAIFSVVQGVLFRPLPFPEADRLVQVWESRLDRGWDRASVAPGNFWSFEEGNHTFEALGAYRFTSANLTGIDYPRRLRMGRVSAGFFGRVLGVHPVLGRTFLPEEGEPGADPAVVLLSNRFWISELGGASSVLGTSLNLDGRSFTVVGVLPPGRPWLNSGDVYVPMARDPDATRVSFEIAVVGRLREDVTVRAAEDDLAGVASRLEEAFPAELAGIGVTVGPSREWVADPETGRALWVLLGAVGVLLMIACVNLANLFLARATARGRETAIRSASGASRGRLVRQALTESVVVSFVGAGLGLALAYGGVRLLPAIAPGGVSGLDEVAIDGWVLAFTAGVGILTGVATGLAPALHALRSDAASVLRSGSQGGGVGRGQRRMRSGLVAVEVALSLMLLVGATLLVRSFTTLMTVDRGFETEQRLLASVDLPTSYAPTDATALTQELLERVSALPGVIRTAAVHVRPLGGGSTGLGFVRPDDPEPEGGIPWAAWRMVTPGYFETLGVPILRGRDFDRDDVAPWSGGTGYVLVSQRVADLLWPGEDPLGRTIVLWAGQNDLSAEVLGVVGNMRERGIDAGPTLAVYLPYLPMSTWAPELVIHTSGTPTAVVSGVRQILSELDPEIPLSNVTTMEDMVGRSVASRRFLMLLVGLFATVALLLSLAGVYGVQSYTTARQTSEIGVRVALGASKFQILGRVMRQAMGPVLVGMALGLMGAYLLSRFMTGLLFEIEATDPVTYASVSAVLGVAAVLAAWLPSRKAATTDAVVAFRAD